jgi:hypothetical protein
MSITESSSESDEPIASRTRSNLLGKGINSARWCTRRCTRDEPISLPSSDSSLSLSSYLETEFLAFPQGPQMAEEPQGLPPNLLEFLDVMTERLQAHNQNVGGPPQSSGTSTPCFSWFPNGRF